MKLRFCEGGVSEGEEVLMLTNSSFYGIIVRMIQELQAFIRGCIVDPILEQKAHTVADETHQTVKSAQETLKKAGTVLDKANDVRGLITLAGVGLLVAGFVAGSMSVNKADEKPQQPSL